MKKLVLISVLGLFSFASFGQTSMTLEELKYIMVAPDGSDAIGIYENAEQSKIQLKTRDAFYKYQLLDSHTSIPLLDVDNQGKECEIDKSRISDGTYKLRIYTEEFIITWDIKIISDSDLIVNSNNEYLSYLDK